MDFRSSSLPASYYQDFLKENISHTGYELGAERLSLKIAMAEAGQMAMVRFGMLAAAFPLETVKILRQVQFGAETDSSRTGAAMLSSKECQSDDGHDEDCDDDLLGLGRSEALLRADSKTIDATLNTSPIQTFVAGKTSVSQEPTPRRSLSGYFESEGAHAASHTSAWPLLYSKHASLIASLSSTAKHHGIFSLWQGLFSSWVHSFAHDWVRSGLEEFMHANSFWHSSIARTPSMQTAAIAIGASAAASFLLSPLELVRTRLVAQSVFASETKTRSFPVALYSIYKEEGGWCGLYPYLASNAVSCLLIPVLKFLPSALFSLYAESWVSAFTRIPSQVASALAQYIFSNAQLLITLPVETVRRRLHLQALQQTGKAKFWRYRVPTSPTPYLSFVDCLRRVAKEEGLAALYQGFAAQAATNTAVLAANIALALENEYPDESESF